MREATKSMHAGDMKHAEAMLFNQAMSLEALFHGLADRSVRARPNVGHSEAYLRMALKAQNQCRMTLETLSVLKNPPTVFARQANINNGGQQQVNNSVAAQRLAKGGNARARATQPSTLKTELLEASNGRRLDPGAARAAGRADPKLAPVGKVHRAPQPGGKGPHIAQRL
jgi:hypothetical protein